MRREATHGRHRQTVASNRSDRPASHIAVAKPVSAGGAALFFIATFSSWAVEATITDGDTLTLNRVPYRLDGIEAPGSDQVCPDEKGAVWMCGTAPALACGDSGRGTKGHPVSVTRNQDGAVNACSPPSPSGGAVLMGG